MTTRIRTSQNRRPTSKTRVILNSARSLNKKRDEKPNKLTDDEIHLVRPFLFEPIKRHIDERHGRVAIAITARPRPGRSSCDPASTTYSVSRKGHSK